MILAIETATPICSVALQSNARTVWEKRIEGRGVHSERLFTFTRELLERAGVGIADLDAVLFSRGPGSYTGLRIGASAIKGLLYQRDVPFYTFSTLLSFAAGLDLGRLPHTVYSVIDARRQHLYLQRLGWDGTNLTQKGNAAVTPIDDIEQEIDDQLLHDETFRPVFVGTGWERLSLEQNFVFNENRKEKVDGSSGHGKEQRIQAFGTESITATSLIKAWQDNHLKHHFREEDPQQFDPDYLEIAQINNTSLNR